MTRPVEPLTIERRRITGALLHRAWLKSGRPDPLIDDDAWDGFALTIVAVADIETGAARVAAPSDGLREALELMVEHHDAHEPLVPDHFCVEVEVARAALATTGQPEPERPCPECGHPHGPLPEPWKTTDGHLVDPVCDWPEGDSACTCHWRGSAQPEPHDPMVGVRIAECPNCGEELSVWPAQPEDTALATTGQPEDTRTADPGGLRAAIEAAARLQDALDALDLATLWLHRTADLPHMPSHQADSWERKARSGRVALKRALTPEATAPDTRDPQEPRYPHDDADE